MWLWLVVMLLLVVMVVDVVVMMKRLGQGVIMDVVAVDIVAVIVHSSAGVAGSSVVGSGGGWRLPGGVFSQIVERNIAECT